MRYEWKILVGKLQGRRTFRRMKRTYTVNIEMNLRKIGICRMGSTGSEKDPVAGFCDHCNESSFFMKERHFLAR